MKMIPAVDRIGKPQNPLKAQKGGEAALVTVILEFRFIVMHSSRETIQ